MAFIKRNGGKPQEISVKVAGVLAEIRPEYLTNTYLKHYCYGSLLNS